MICISLNKATILKVEHTVKAESGVLCEGCFCHAMLCGHLTVICQVLDGCKKKKILVPSVLCFTNVFAGGSAFWQSSGDAKQAAVARLAVRLTYEGVVMREVTVPPDGVAVLNSVDFNQKPGNYTLSLELSPLGPSALPSQV